MKSEPADANFASAGFFVLLNILAMEGFFGGGARDEN
jgi:hypothetical protein